MFCKHLLLQKAFKQAFGMKKGSGNPQFNGAKAAALAARRWSLLKVAPLVVLLMVVAIAFLNLEAVFPQYYQSSGSPRFQSDHRHRRRDEHPHAVRDLNWPTSTYLNQKRPVHRSIENGSVPKWPGTLIGEEMFACDRSHPRTDVCHMKGDVRMESGSFVLYAKNEDTALGDLKIKPYTRKWEKSCMDIVHEVSLKSIRAAAEDEGACDVRHSVPAVVFTTGGYTGNVYHEFHDGLIPLYITSQHLKREVVFIIVEFHNWWLTKYEDVVKQLTNYPVLNFDNDTRIHCFPEVTVGLHIHDEMAIDPAFMPHNETIREFRGVLDRAYSDDRRRPPPLPAIEQPRLVIIVRNDTRVILNLDRIVALAEEVGFQVELCHPLRTTELKKIYWTLNSSDVLLGVHGAAMTHFLFMRPGSVFIQIVPLGTTWAAGAYYGQPAQKLGLQYIAYEVQPEESSLSDKYDKNDTVLTNPEAVIEKGWWVVKGIYLEKQDVRPSLPRFKRTLRDAKAKALAFMAKRS